MKKHLLFVLSLLLISINAIAAKTVYIPDSWVYNSSTQEYTEGGNSDLQWSFNRSKQSDNCIIFWQQGFGNNPASLTDSNYRFDPDEVLQVAEQCYAMNVNTLGFSCSNMLNKYKIIILMNYTTTWTCYGGGYDFEVSALWLNPATVHPAGHSLAHEVGHSFHYMCYAEAANYSHNSSGSINTGFHLACGNGQAIWEQTAQWQANQTYPDQMFPQSYPLFGNNANYAFSHEWMRYQSYWFLYYLCQYHNDITTVAQVWKQPMTGQSNGNATDFCQAYMALKGLSASQFYERYFDYALRCATFDFDAAANYRDNYIGKFDYHAVQVANNKYQVAYASAPQSTGFNVIELNVPASGTTVTTNFTALTHGCALASADPAEYNNGVANALVSANVTNYNSAGTASYRGFRVGYVFLKSDGTRVYSNDNTVHCTGTAETTETISASVPANTSRMFLVIAPSLTTYVKHAWDDNILNDDQWPYQFELVNTTAKSISPYFEEPEFTKQIDGRTISDVTLTYNVVLPPTNDYDGASVNFSGSGLNALCTAFQMEGDNIFNNAVGYSANQANGTIMNYAVNSSMQLQTSATNTNGDFGHWFNASGTVANWGNNTVAFIEFTKSTKSAVVGQYPGANSNGTTRTIREALVYKNSSGQTATAYMIFNITFDSNVTSGYSYLSDIDYVEPSTVETASATAYRARNVQAISMDVMQGETKASDAIDSSTLATALNNLSESNLTGSFYGYYDPLSSATSGNNVYYYALNGAPTASTSSQGTVTYYQVASVTNNADFSGQYVHYFNTSGGAVSDVANGKIIVAYDKTEKKFSVKATDDCPTGTYTLYLGMARRVYTNRQYRVYVGYFPITVTVTEYRETDEWDDITAMPDDYSKYFFIFKDHTLNLYLTMRDGAHQGNKTMWYSHQDADKPENNKNSLWTIDAYGDTYGLITNAGYRDLMLQTEYNAPWNYRTHDNGAGDFNWGRVTFDYNSTKEAWTIQNGTYPDNGYLGPWEELFVDGAEVACNKQGANIGYFDISKILRGEYVATYEDLTSVDYNNPLDITYVLENEGGERRNSIGWKTEGAAWWSQGSTDLNGKVGDYFLESWRGGGLEATDLYQTIYGLPNGTYRFSAIAHCSSNCIMYANSEQVTMPSNNQGDRTSVEFYLTGGELRLGFKTGDNPGEWIAFDDAKLEYISPYYILDETAVNAPSAANGVNVKFKRTIIDKNNGGSTNAWNTICFPFSLNSSQITAIFGEGTVVKELTGVTPVGENSSLTFTDVTSISANTPYIMQVQPGNAKTEYIIENIDITPSTDLTVTVDGLDFIGNYTYNTETPLIPQGDFYLLNDKFKQSKNGTKLKGFRAYFHIPAGSPIKALGFYDGSATGIESLDAYNIVLPADIYSIGGQLVRKNADSLDNLPAGIYFINGKKVLKR